MLHALLDDVSMDRLPDALPEKRLEMRRAHPRDRRKFSQREIGCEVLLHVVDDGSQLPPSEAAFWNTVRRLRIAAQQMDGQCGAQALSVQAVERLSGLKRRLQRPADML